MSSTSTSHIVRRSFALPRTLIEELVAYAPEELKDNLNRLVTTALREYAERKKKEVFSCAMADMAQDPAVRAECEAIDREFMSAELDGIKENGNPAR